MRKSKKNKHRARELRIRELQNKSNVFDFHASLITVAELTKVKLFLGGISQTANTALCVKSSDSGSDTPGKPDRPFPRKPLRRRKNIKVLKKRTRIKLDDGKYGK